MPFDSEALNYAVTVNFLHYAVFLFVVCSAVLVLVSLMTAPPSKDSLVNLTYERGAVGIEAGSTWNRVNMGLSLILLGCLAWLWWTFR